MTGLAVNGITGGYATTGDIVRGVDLHAPFGTLTCVIGPNGAGKSTALKLAAGLLRLRAGQVVLGSDTLTGLAPQAALAAGLVFVPQERNVFPRLSVAENLRVYGHLYGVRGLERRIQELSSQLDLGEFLNRPAGNLSAGQKTRVALAKALVNRPDVLLLDEPTASLDPDTGDMVRSWLERYRAESGCTILLASHNMAEVERLCGQVLMLKSGRIVDGGSPAELLDRYGRDDMEQVFLDIARNRGPQSPEMAA